jgi:hypothetical protein
MLIMSPAVGRAHCRGHRVQVIEPGELKVYVGESERSECGASVSSRYEFRHGNDPWDAEPGQASGQSVIGRQAAAQRRTCRIAADPGQASGESCERLN